MRNVQTLRQPPVAEFTRIQADACPNSCEFGYRRLCPNSCEFGYGRSAYTLVELLVVLVIIAVVAGMAAMFMPGFELRERSGSGASQLQQWLMMARQRALHDRTPTGLRLLRDDEEPNFFTKAQFIQQPDDFTGGTAVSEGGNPLQIRISETDITGGFSDQQLWPVQIGDYFQIHGAGLMHQIANIQPGLLTLASPLPEAVTSPTSHYRIVRRPRPLDGKIMLMPNFVGIDLNTNGKYGAPLTLNPDGTMDIVFLPSGAVEGNQVSERLIFWIREYTTPQGDEFTGEPSLIVLYTRSGLVEAYPVDDRNKTNPYSKVR